ncbi:hypothetical protein AB0892_04205 [Streptomyces sp. NPDC005409]|uniref:hypothetical protein n=1 Tax=Streptomyces sp. NPDC005409 TaxID=3155342 RepID=UPI0034511A4F
MTRRQLTDAQQKFIGPYLPIGRYGSYPERLREQFEGVIWRFSSSGHLRARRLRRALHATWSIDTLADGWIRDEVHAFEEGEQPRRLWRVTQTLPR